jgi:hypothetical protein
MELPLEIACDPLEASPILPIEVLREIALKAPGAYLVLVQTCKRMHFDMDWVMRHFTTWMRKSPYQYDIYDLAWRLPNGNLHVNHNNDHTVIHLNGDKMWYYYNKIHRGDDLPALQGSDGHQSWFMHGLQHRDNDMPSCINTAGDKWWYQHGKNHRSGGRPAIMFTNGCNAYYEYGCQTRPTTD